MLYLFQSIEESLSLQLGYCQTKCASLVPTQEGLGRGVFFLRHTRIIDPRKEVPQKSN